MYFLLYKQILVEFGVSKKVITSPGEYHEVINAVKNAFDIKEEIFLQKFDEDWQEYIDFPEGKLLENKARLKVILKVSYFSSFSFKKFIFFACFFFKYTLSFVFSTRIY